MKLPYMADQCEQMLKISSEFVRLQVSHDEYLCMKVLLLLSTGQTFYLRAAEPPLPLSHVECGVYAVTTKAITPIQYCPQMLKDSVDVCTGQKHFPNSLTDMQL